jgi:hypothetical protein
MGLFKVSLNWYNIILLYIILIKKYFNISINNINKGFYMCSRHIIKIYIITLLLII